MGKKKCTFVSNGNSGFVALENKKTRVNEKKNTFLPLRKLCSDDYARDFCL